MNNQHISGSAAELYVASHFVANGQNVLWPLLTQSRYDFVVDDGASLYKVQVKKATKSKTGNFEYLQARLSSRNANCKPKYLEGEFDFFAFTDMQRIWIAPFKELEGYTSVCLDSTNPKYKPQTKYNAASWIVNSS